MNERERTRKSKFLSLVLRHQPELVGITLGEGGWVAIELLLAGCEKQGKGMSRQTLDEIVATSPKQRFAISEDGLRIRANQGHSVQVELGYEPTTPPAQLFHGTVDKFLPAIRAGGLAKMQRHHVHLSPDRKTASTVGERRGKAIILVIRAGEMSQAGHEFFVSDNGVWLTEEVPPEFIDFPE
jgi:putative RNA 2'-phosphotransferase